jgi:hypothetical protein
MRNLFAYWQYEVIPDGGLATYHATGRPPHNRTNDAAPIGLWIVNLRDCELYLVSRLDVSHWEHHRKAVERLVVESVYAAAWYAIAVDPQPILKNFRVTHLADALSLKRYKPGSPRAGQLWPQQLNLTAISSEAAELLCRAWDSATKK